MNGCSKFVGVIPYVNERIESTAALIHRSIPILVDGARINVQSEFPLVVCASQKTTKEPSRSLEGVGPVDDSRSGAVEFSSEEMAMY